MRTKEVVIGRAATPATVPSGVDIDLWEEGDASRVSRQQAVLKLKKDCEFYIKNISATRPLLINGRQLPPGKKRRVADGSLIECGHLEMLVEVNKPLIARLKRQMLAA
jgi:microspherule protein 1/U3 small nucleolar RNA-associated protein 25